ncbi:rhomboid family intramembrane serine protease [Terriglobus roseus]|uniref:Membrane associated serine protease, rhomboid family n=1 Tax=Terriglobus roseus TaxID=392734 RepID=A0A1G7QT38_9BACT|nr:rhomboid family intramembrane serine protease [Terriglobus roseus]SDG01686.1 Membrane associated serine protease, rhomboid family [Terriglobus roseus]
MSPRDPVTLTLPPFRGAVRRLVISLLAVYLLTGLLALVSPAVGRFLQLFFLLSPWSVVRHGYIWQLLTYPFFNSGIISFAFALLNLWFTGSMLEDIRGARWFTELFYVSALGGSILATLLTALPPLVTGGRIILPHLDPTTAVGGVGAPLFGVLIAFAIFFGDTEFLLFFVLRAKAKYVVWIGGLIYVAMLIFEGNALWALLAICSGLSGYAYTKLAHRTGLSTSTSERWYGLRNAYYRWKRRRAARKFEVYMRKQDRIVKFDEDGRYIAPEEEESNPQDRKWMN